jgi:hypothetical protein|tara:strand:- start:10676 stop:11257 length:582 start_codon:yes stop_codon:yes gene_type:complete
MQDIYDIIKNIERIYDSTTNFKILKDFERVLDELNVYVYDNWMDGELAEGPIVDRHWITCKFFWLRKNMPDPEGGKRLLDYNCKVTYQKEFLIKPRKIRTPDDIRPGTKKGKLDRETIWIVSITMPKKLIADIYRNYKNDWDWETEPNEDIGDSATSQPADMAVDPGMADPGIDPALPADAVPAEPPAAGGTE